MKKLIVTLLGCSLALGTAVGAKQDDPKKKSAKAGPVQQQPQHVKAAPKSKAKVPPTNPNVNSVNAAKVQKNNLKHHDNELRKTNTVQPKHPPVVQPNTVVSNPKSLKKHDTTVQKNELPAVQNNPKTHVQSNPLTTVQKNPKTVVNSQQNAANIQRIRSKYRNFKAAPNQSIASAQFNQNYRIQNAHNWTGPQYRVFQTYRPQWHDREWWHSHHSNNIVLIAGGWYYWSSGYWYPAWGYDTSAAYYPYDGPIYAGPHRRPFDEVVADVQASLQEQGYYRGEVDGLVGPLTRQALSDYQRDHGLTSTAALDQPTLDSLGLG